jgi:hypothetical protein
MTPLALGGIATVDVPVSLLPVAGARVDAFALAANREDSASLVSVDGWARRFPWLVAALGELSNVISASHARAGCIPFAI